jgi:hypothetical protein
MALAALAVSHLAWVLPARSRAAAPRMQLREFGDNFYLGHTYETTASGQNNGPLEAGALPENVYEVALQMPLGINFEDNGYPKGGVKVIGLVEDGNAFKSGKIQVDDDLVGVTAIIVRGSKYERRMLPCLSNEWDFERVVDAIKSNTRDFQCEDCIMQFRRDSGRLKALMDQEV